MLRSAGKLVGSASVGVAASPSSSQCRAQQPRTSTYSNKDAEHCNNGAHTSLLPERKEEIEVDWVITDLKRQMDEDQVVFGSEEIDETMNSVLSFIGIQSDHSTEHEKSQQYDVQEPDSDSDAADSSAVEYQMRAAEMQLAPNGMREDMARMLNTMLHDEEVQRACVRALRRDPAFEGMLRAPQASTEVFAAQLLPASARAYQANSEDGQKNPFEHLLERLAKGLIELGDKLKNSAFGARDAIGHFFLEFGCFLEDIWRHNFAKEPHQLPKHKSEDYQERVEAMGNTVIVVACAILSIVLLKRVHIIRLP